MSESPAFSVRWPAVAVGVVHATVVNGSCGLAPVAVPRSSMSYEPMYAPQFVTRTSSDIPLPLVLNSCGEFVAVMTPHSAEKVGLVLLPPDAAPSRAKAAPGRRRSAAAVRATALRRMFELFMAHSIGAVRCASNRTLVLRPRYAAGTTAARCPPDLIELDSPAARAELRGGELALGRTVDEQRRSAERARDARAVRPKLVE